MPPNPTPNIPPLQSTTSFQLPGEFNTSGKEIIKRVFIENFDPFYTNVYTAAGVQATTKQHVVADTVTLAAGTATVTFSGNAVFSSATSYIVTVVNRSNNNALKVVKVSGTQITITSAGATDVVDFICIGN